MAAMLRRAAFFVLFVGCSSAVSSSSDGGQQPDGQAPDGGSGGDGGGGGDAAPCVDKCPAPNGSVTLACQKRFVYGVNYAWRDFAGDFGGIAQWGVKGVSGAPSGYAADLADMQKQGANVIRWWLFPDFRSDGVTFDGMNVPTGVTATALADFAKALELADQAGVFLMPTFFSFDNFRPTQTNQGVLIRGIAPIALDANARKALVDLARARLFPDIGIGFGASYSTAPSAVIQNNAWVIDPFNRFGWGVAIGARWNLDLLPAQARVQQAEAQLEETRAMERYALGGIAVEVEAPPQGVSFPPSSAGP